MNNRFYDKLQSSAFLKFSRLVKGVWSQSTVTGTSQACSVDRGWVAILLVSMAAGHLLGFPGWLPSCAHSQLCRNISTFISWQTQPPVTRTVNKPLRLLPRAWRPEGKVLSTSCPQTPKVWSPQASVFPVSSWLGWVLHPGSTSHLPHAYLCGLTLPYVPFPKSPTFPVHWRLPAFSRYLKYLQTWRGKKKPPWTSWVPLSGPFTCIFTWCPALCFDSSPGPHSQPSLHTPTPSLPNW